MFQHSAKPLPYIDCLAGYYLGLTPASVAYIHVCLVCFVLPSFLLHPWLKQRPRSVENLWELAEHILIPILLWLQQKKKKKRTIRWLIEWYLEVLLWLCKALVFPNSRRSGCQLVDGHILLPQQTRQPLAVVGHPAVALRRRFAPIELDGMPGHLLLWQHSECLSQAEAQQPAQNLHPNCFTTVRSLRRNARPRRGTERHRLHSAESIRSKIPLITLTVEASCLHLLQIVFSNTTQIFYSSSYFNLDFKGCLVETHDVPEISYSETVVLNISCNLICCIFAGVTNIQQ